MNLTCALGSMSPRTHEAHGQLSLTWSEALPDDARATLRSRLLGLPRLRRRSLRANHPRFRALWEQRGAAVLGSPDEHESKHALHVVRVYYTSQGNESLCFEVILASVAAYRLASETRAQIWRVGKDAPHVRHGSRFVVLPSQDASAASHKRANMARARADHRLARWREVERFAA